MNNNQISLTNKLRPIRFSTTINPSSKMDLKKCIELYSCQWGGKYNSLTPLLSKVPSWWSKSFQPKSTEITTGYINAFEPDYLLKLASKKTVKIDFPAERLLSFDDIWNDDNEELLNIGTPSLDIYEDLYHKEFKFERKRKIEIILPLAANKKYELFIAACFGKFPENEVGKRHYRNYKSFFDAQEVKIDSTNFIQYIRKTFISPISIGSFGLKKIRTTWSRGPTILVLDAEKPEDIFDFWNLRALGFSILPIPIQWADELLNDCVDFITMNHVPIKHNPSGLKHRTSILLSRQLSKIQKDFFSGMLSEQCKEGFHYSNYPRVWDDWARDKDHSTRCLIYHKEDRGEAFFENGDLRYKTLLPDFDYSYIHNFGPAWAITTKFSRSYSEHQVPEALISTVDNIDTYLISGSENARIDSQEGLVLCLSKTHDLAYLKNFNSENLFKKWFKKHDIDLSISPPGRTTLEMISAIGGLLNTRVLADYLLIKTLNEVAMGLYEETVTEEGGNRVLSKRSINKDKLFGILKRINNNRPVAFQNHLKNLITSKVLKLGLETQCLHCQTKNWHSLQMLNEILSCEHCLQNYSFPLSDPPKSSWYYRTIGPFSVENFGRGSYTALLSLNYLVNTIDGPSTWVPSMSSDKKESFEFDFALWKEVLRFGVKEHFKIFGECKTNNDFSAKDIQRMKELANNFPGSILVFATLKEELNKKEKNRILNLAYWGRKNIAPGKTRAPVLVLTRKELTNDLPIPYCWEGSKDNREEFAKNKYSYSGLKEMCNLTQQVYLDGTCFYKWREEEFKKSNRRTKK